MAASDTPKFTVPAYHGDAPFCFVSYSHDDSDVVFEELRRLSEVGYRVYYDEGIHPGHAWHDELARAIEKCDLFALFITRSSISSANCLRELNFALDKQKPVLAIHLDDVELPPGLQLALGDRQAIVRSRFEEAAFRARIDSAVGDYVRPREPATNEPPPQAPSLRAPMPLSRRIIPIVAALALLLGSLGGGYYLYQERQQENQDYESALVDIDRLIKKDRFADAYLIMRQLDPREDPRRSEYAERIVVPGALKIQNDGVEVFFRPYGQSSVDWLPIGTTPFEEDILLPRGALHMRLVLDGHVTREFVASNPGPMFGNNIYLENMGALFEQQPVRLTQPGVIPPEMINVPASSQPVFLSGWSRDVLGTDIIAPTPRFFVSKFEVTNAEFKEFIAAGGYTDPQYWQGLRFGDGEGALSFSDAMGRFVDRTGRPGPATWELSSYAEGEGDLPVGGVSWYEAAAYARFRGLALPTIYQWVRFALGPLEGLYPLAGVVSKASNFSSRGLVPVQQEIGLGPWGTYNTAGNVREWVWNQAGDYGIIQGSSWQSYGNYSAVITAPRFNRHETNGIRLVQNDLLEPFDTDQLDPIDLVYDDPHTKREPVSDEVFEGMRYQFTTPRREPMDVQVEQVEATDLWTVDEHRLKFSEEETFTLYIFNPTNVKPPFQTVIYGPPGNAVQPGQSNRDAVPTQIANFNYILKGGRTVVLPIWEGTYARNRPLPTDPAEASDAQRIVALSWHRDAVITINYLEGLDDYAADNLTYMGYSFGAAWFGQLVVALENRISNAIFVSGGLVHTRKLHPMLDAINYAPRITQPVLQLNGIYDHLFPWKQSAQRHFELLGTPPDQKKLVGYDAGHIGFPENQLIAEIADWMDAQMGRVR